MNLDLRFKDRRVLVVGGSYGIGKASAAMMAAEGAALAIASRGTENLQAAAQEIQGNAMRIVCDVTKAGSGEQLAEAVAEQWTGLDVLVTAVGGSIRSSFADLKDEDWLGNYEFNVLSAVRTIRAALPLLEKGHEPAIVMLGAAASKMPYQHQVVSNVHKAGLLGLTKTLAAELADRGIRVNLVAPGRTLTPLWTRRASQMAMDEGRSQAAVLADFSQDIPLQRFGTPEEVAAMVVWLASPVASYVTGQAINVDGGIARGLL